MNKLGLYIKAYRMEHNMSIREFAAHANISHTRIADIEKANSDQDINLNMKMYEQLAEALGVDFTTFLLDIGLLDSEVLSSPTITASDLVQIPVLGVIRAGEPIFAEESIMSYESIPQSDVQGGEYFCLLVTGDSMKDARIYDGDTILIRQQADVANREIAACLVDGETATLKRIIKTGQGVFLQPENPKYDPLFFTKEQLANQEMVILGKAIKVLPRTIH